MPKITIKEVEAQILKVMKDWECSRTEAEYRLMTLGTGKLRALEKYKKTLPEGKRTKGIFKIVKPNKLAEKAKKLTPYLTAETEADKPKTKAKPKPKAKAKAKAKPKAKTKVKEPEQLTMEEAAAQ